MNKLWHIDEEAEEKRMRLIALAKEVGVSREGIIAIEEAVEVYVYNDS